MYHSFWILSSIEGHLGSFQLLTIINKAAMNIMEHVSLLHARESFGYMSRRGIAGSLEVSCPVFWGTARLISKVVVPSYNPTSSGGVFLFLYILANTCLSPGFLILAILTGVSWNLRVVLIWISLMTNGVEHFLRCFSAIRSSSGENSLFSSVPHF